MYFQYTIIKMDNGICLFPICKTKEMKEINIKLDREDFEKDYKGINRYPNKQIDLKSEVLNNGTKRI